MNSLNVELYGSLLGTLSEKGKRVEFEVNPGVFGNYQISSTIMSIAVPLNLRYTTPQKMRALNFFKELLPEGRNLEWLASSLPRDERNVFGILRKYGKDIAGALTIYDSEDAASTTKPDSEPVDGKMIRYLLEHMPQAPLANSLTSGKTSLGGVQGKILLAKKGQAWHRVHNGYPSTHILKPVVPEYPTMIYDEAFCMQVAYDSGLTGYPVWIEDFDGVDALVIERYDRNHDVVGARVHQEDFNQALGASGSEKYQEYSGKVSAKRIAQTLQRFGSGGDVEKFASQLIFAAAIGNLDMHAKNVSILHLPDESTQLAPTYDQVPLRHHSVDGKLALSVGGEYAHASLTLANIVAELTSWQYTGFSSESETVEFARNCLEAYGKVVESAMPDKKAYPNLKSDILLFISRLLSEKSIGNSSDRQ